MHPVGIIEIYVPPQWHSQEQRRKRRAGGVGGGKELTCNRQQHQWNHYYAALHRAWIAYSSPMRVCVSLCECVVWVVVFFSPVLKFQTFIELFAFLLNFAHTLCSFSFPFFSLISFFFLISFLLFSHSHTHFTVSNFARFTVTILRTMGEKNKMPHCVCVCPFAAPANSCSCCCCFFCFSLLLQLLPASIAKIHSTSFIDSFSVHDTHAHAHSGTGTDTNTGSYSYSLGNTHAHLYTHTCTNTELVCLPTYTHTFHIYTYTYTYSFI